MDDDGFTEEEQARLFAEAVAKVTSYLKTEIGVRIETFDGGSAVTGELRLANLDDQTLDQIEDMLLACREIELAIGPCPSPEYENLVEKVADKLLGPIDPVAADPNAHVDWRRRAFDPQKVADLVALAKVKPRGDTPPG